MENHAHLLLHSKLVEAIQEATAGEEKPRIVLSMSNILA